MKDIKELMGSESLSRNRDKLMKAASGSDGQAVLGMLDADKLQKSLDEGDADAVKSAIEGAMRTEAGQRLFKELSEILKK